MASKALALVNRLSADLAFAAIAVGVTAALAIIWGPGGKDAEVLWRVLGTAVATFLGAAAALCTIKFFVLNQRSAGG
jgi:multisubunit Na+/H+ antiporter MnhB subunit